jgi:hypothetical protein
MGRGNPDQQAGGGNDAVVRAKDGGTQPAEMLDLMDFPVLQLWRSLIRKSGLLAELRMDIVDFLFVR